MRKLYVIAMIVLMAAILALGTYQAAGQTPLQSTDVTYVPFDNTFPPGPWLTQPFMTADGEQHTLAEFEGRTVVIHALSVSCEMCLEQHQRILESITLPALGDDGAPLPDQPPQVIERIGDTVILALSVRPPELPQTVRRLYPLELGAYAPVIDSLAQDDSQAAWIAGVASREMVRMMEDAFGPAISEPDMLWVIVVSPTGEAHLMPEGIINPDDLLAGITYYAAPPVDVDATATPVLD
jgi:hypothetical protein